MSSRINFSAVLFLLISVQAQLDLPPYDQNNPPYEGRDQNLPPYRQNGPPYTGSDQNVRYDNVDVSNRDDRRQRFEAPSTRDIRGLLQALDVQASQQCTNNVAAQWNFETNVNQVTQLEAVSCTMQLRFPKGSNRHGKLQKM